MFGTRFGNNASSVGFDPLLLDQFGGAAAAYSVRKLSSSYSGSALRVRRSSDNAEQDIGFSGNDLDTSALTTFVGANDGFVVTWYDQSGNSKNITNSVASNQPQIASSGTVLTKNSLPTVNFSGIEWLDLAGTPTIGNVGVYTTFSIDTAAQDSVMVFAANSTDQHYWSKGMSTTNKYGSRVRNDNGGVSVIDRGGTLTDITSLHQFSLLFDIGATTPTSSVFLDQVAATETRRTRTSAVNYIVSLGAQGGGLSRFSGNISEVIIFEEDTTSFRTAIESNINTYYSIY